MAASGQNVLVVDDQQSNRDLIGKIMGDEYQLKYATTGEQCIEITESWEPDVILMDVNMPGMGGLEACKKVKEKSNCKTLPIIFLSSMSDVAERIAGYEAGGDDYISKPFDHAELVKKVDLAIDNKKKLDTFKQSSNDAMGMAMTAMSQASNVGNILRFYQDSFVIDSVESLAKLLSEAINSFDVNAVLYFKVNDEDFYYSSTGVIKPLEQSAIENLRDKDRIYSFSQRTIFNYGVVSALIVDMPVDDEIKYGELKDNIAIIVEGTEARMNALLVHLDREKNQNENSKIIKATKVSLAALEQQQVESQEIHESIFKELVTDIQESFTRFGLSDNQEKELMDSLDVVLTKSNDLFEKNKILRKKIKTIIGELCN